MKALADSLALLCERTARLESSFNTHSAQSRAPHEPEAAEVSYHAPTNHEERKPLGKAPVHDGMELSEATSISLVGGVQMVISLLITA